MSQLFELARWKGRTYENANIDAQKAECKLRNHAVTCDYELKQSWWETRSCCIRWVQLILQCLQPWEIHANRGFAVQMSKIMRSQLKEVAAREDSGWCPQKSRMMRMNCSPVRACCPNYKCSVPGNSDLEGAILSKSAAFFIVWLWEGYACWQYCVIARCR